MKQTFNLIRKLCLALLVVLIAAGISAQQKNISGTVTDANRTTIARSDCSS